MWGGALALHETLSILFLLYSSFGSIRPGILDLKGLVFYIRGDKSIDE
jgi:hypothetical protein